MSQQQEAKRPIETVASQLFRRPTKKQKISNSLLSDSNKNNNDRTISTLSPPEILLNSQDCMAQSISVSKDHATILLQTKKNNIATNENKNKNNQDNNNNNNIRSLLKLSVLPTHTTFLEPTNDVRGLTPNDLNGLFTFEESTRICNFLSNFNFTLSSESGAEYSYYDVTPKTITSTLAGIGGGLFNNVMSLFNWYNNPTTTSSCPIFCMELISPASERQIQYSMPKIDMCLIEETPTLYEKVVEPYIKTIVKSGSLSWIDNIISGKKEKERLLLDTKHYTLNIDTKWKTHPNPNTIPKTEWKTYSKAIEDLHCLALLKEKNIKTIRDLRRRHIPILQDVITQGCNTIHDVYNIPKNQLRIFFHYHPQFYHLHIHFTRLTNDIGCQVERGHLVSDVIQNLQLDDEYYCKRTISYKLRTNEPLYKTIISALI